MLMIITYKY